MSFLVSKSVRAAARRKHSPDPFIEIELTTDHVFNESEIIRVPSGSDADLDKVISILCPKEYKILDHEDDALWVFRREVSVFLRDDWYLCVRKDEVLIK